MKKTPLSEAAYYKIFFKVRDTFNNVTDEQYTEYFYRNDQVLFNIALYLLENFKGDYVYCSTVNDDCLERCNYLNTWLNEKKSLYTSNGKCTNNSVLWEKYIEGLWTKLQDSVDHVNKCNRVPLKADKFDKNHIIPSCSNAIAMEIQGNFPDALATEKTECPVTTVPTSSSCKAFSSVGLKLNNFLRGKKIKSRNMNYENNESLSSDNNYNMESLDRRFNVIYNSFEN
ncbi:PIR Superfamily Protein [Plasmodium ovale curtisi]|uniref:PIR Superfamily Protein n=1 Tax=Plasmodium ovale curtisi TaxID=864141 RepID=A0A1A8WJS0_PLAOA|nr:PIR Superfamily Protein [Plasmodium ovale curtisi]